MAPPLLRCRRCCCFPQERIGNPESPAEITHCVSRAEETRHSIIRHGGISICMRTSRHISNAHLVALFIMARRDKETRRPCPSICYFSFHRCPTLASNVQKAMRLVLLTESDELIRPGTIRDEGLVAQGMFREGADGTERRQDVHHSRSPEIEQRTCGVGRRTLDDIDPLPRR